MTFKTKAISAFLAGISHQIPEHALSLLLKDGDKALTILLQKSIEALPMGSPIRKSVDGDMEVCVQIMKQELKKRISEQEPEEAETGVDEEGSHFLPVVNHDIFQHNVDLAMKQGDTNKIHALQCMDLVSLDMIAQENETTDGVMKKFSSLMVSGQCSGQDLNSFIRLFANGLAANGAANLIKKIKDLRAFIRLFQVAVSSSPCEDIDLENADDLGKLVGCLVSISILEPETYSEVMKTTSAHDSSGDDSSGDEDDIRPKKRRKISSSELKRVQKECKKDALLCLSLILANFSQSRRLRATAASFTIGFVKAIMLNDTDVLVIITGEKSVSEVQEAKLAREASSYIVEAMELSNCMARRDLPSTSLISDGKKRCLLIQRWAQNLVPSAAPVRNVLNKNEGRVNRMEMDSESEASKGNEEEIARIEVGGSDEDAESEDANEDESARQLFVMDTQPNASKDNKVKRGPNEHIEARTKKSPKKSKISPKAASTSTPNLPLTNENAEDKMNVDDAAVKPQKRAKKSRKSPKGVKKSAPNLPLTNENAEDKMDVDDTAAKAQKSASKSPKGAKRSAPSLPLPNENAEDKMDLDDVAVKAQKSASKSTRDGVSPLSGVSPSPANAVYFTATGAKNTGPALPPAIDSARQLFALDIEGNETKVAPNEPTAKDIDNSEVKTKKSPRKPKKSLKGEKKSAPNLPDTKENAGDKMDVDDAAVKPKKSPSKSKKSTRGTKNVISALPPVPENEEAGDISTEDKDGNTLTASPSGHQANGVDDSTPPRVARSRARTNSTSSVDTPSRLTRSRARGLSTSSMESVESEAPRATPLKRRSKTRPTSNASETDDDAPTPRRSARKRK